MISMNVISYVELPPFKNAPALHQDPLPHPLTHSIQFFFNISSCQRLPGMKKKYSIGTIINMKA
jgi:hypothetical protein